MILDNPFFYIVGYVAAWVILIISSLLSIRFLRRRKDSRVNRIASNLVAIVTSIVFLILAMEGYYGFFYDEPDSYGLLLTSTRWFKRHYKFNNMGFRDDKDYYHEKEKGKLRVVFVGDSFTVGHGIKNISKRFSGIIEARLKEEMPDTNYEVYTLAQNGWDTVHEVDSLNRLMDVGFEADLIILCYNMNDIGWGTPETGMPFEYARPENWLLSHSFFLNFLYARTMIFSTKGVKDYYGWLSDYYTGRTWEWQRMLLQELKALCAKKGIKLKVAVFPLIPDMSKGFKMKSAHERVNAFFREEGIPYIDISDKFRELPAKKLMVNKFDAHPNEFAHKVIAEEIWDKLLRN